MPEILLLFGETIKYNPTIFDSITIRIRETATECIDELVIHAIKVSGINIASCFACYMNPLTISII